MKTLPLTVKEYMILRQLAIQYGYTFEHSYEGNTVTVVIAEEFCDAFGF